MQSTLPLNNLHKSERGRTIPIFSFVVTILVLVCSLLIVANRQYILDTVHFWSYQPTADVASIASRVRLTDSGKFSFYAAQPAVEDSQKFNMSCGRTEQSTAILGCYVNDKIYLYNVTDNRLDGIKEVTAAHEMLHAVYQRMSDSDRAKVNELVEAEYRKISTNPSFIERMAFYARTEPGERDNELHSIIGTEVANISPELDAHYSKYFTDRSSIVALRNGYEAEFDRLDKQAKALGAQLDSISKQVDAGTAKYNNDVKQLNADITDFNRRAESGSFSTRTAFNNERLALQQRVRGLGDLRNTINNLIDKYEALRSQYNETVTQSKILYQSIDSTLVPAPSV